MKQGGIVLGVECAIIHQDCAHASRASSGTDVSIKRCSSSGGKDGKDAQHKKREAHGGRESFAHIGPLSCNVFQ